MPDAASDSTNPTAPPPRRKKMIEVALPLEAINTASAREKSIRHGHPSTLHLWWARRPLAACRAVLFSSLVDDPDSDPRYRRPDGTVDTEAAGVKRAELFNLIEELVLWENSNNEKVINAARAEIARCVVSRKVELGEVEKTDAVGPEGADLKNATAWDVILMRAPAEVVNHVLVTLAPPVLDPFAGGGSIPLEAQRLGLRAHASDLNPVAVLINKALIEIPPKFAGMPPVHPDAEKRTSWKGAEGLAEDVRLYGKWMRDEAEKKIGHLYPKVRITEEMAEERPDLSDYVGQELTVIAWLWARTVPSPDPAMNGEHVPLVKSYWLSKRIRKEAFVKPCVNKERRSYTFEIQTGRPNAEVDPTDATMRKQGAECIITGSAMPFAYLRECGKNGTMSQRLMAVVVEGRGRRLYLPPSEKQEALATEVEPPDVPSTPLPDRALGIQAQLYGLDEHRKLFTERQLLMLKTLCDTAKEMKNKIKSTGKAVSEEYSDALQLYLALTIDRLADLGNSLNRWEPNAQCPRQLFGRQAIPMIWDFAEGNPLGSSSGSWKVLLRGLAGALGSVAFGYHPTATGQVAQANAASEAAYHGELVSCDPPYYDNIGYADLSDFFYFWLRMSLGESYPDLLSTMMVPKADELIATAHRHDGDREAAATFFENGLNRTVAHWRGSTEADFPTTIFYAFKQTETESSGTASTGWETFLEGIVAQGYCITATWPMRTECVSRMRSFASNVLASSIVLACVPRGKSAGAATRREFTDALRKDLPAAVAHMQSSHIAPVDLAQASIGPGMEVFSRYTSVRNPDGTSFTVREALRLINQVLDEALAELEGNADPHTRWAVAWFEQFGMEEGPFGTAETLSTAKGVSVAGVAEAGICHTGRSKVRLLKRDELPEDWDPATDPHLTLWEVTHHLIKRLESGGTDAAGALLAAVGPNHAQPARDLAYRLYSVAERKKWAPVARGYNDLASSWTAIERAAREPRPAPPTPTGETADMFN